LTAREKSSAIFGEGMNPKESLPDFNQVALGVGELFAQTLTLRLFWQNFLQEKPK
jgi:hypothetical protein